MRQSGSATVAAVQFASLPLARAENLSRISDHVADAHARGARLIVFPELANLGYCETADLHTLAEDQTGPTIRTCIMLSQRHGVYLAAGFAEYHDRHVYNSLAFTTPRGEVSVYRKRHLIFWEHYYFRSGREPLIVETELGRIGFAICADMMYDHVWSTYRGRIDLAVISAAWPRSTKQTTGRVGWVLQPSGALAGELPARIARELGIAVVFSNQCGPCEVRIPMMGRAKPAAFAGRSAVYDPLGAKLTVDPDGEGVALASVQISKEPSPCVTLSG